MLGPDEFDEIEFQAARTGNHVRAAVQMTELAHAAERGAAYEGMSVAEAHMRAGEQWLMADDPESAATEFQQAIDEGGATFADPRVFLARALLTMDKPTEAAPIIAALEAQRERINPRTCDLLAELYTDRGDLVTALDWANCGVERCMETDDKVELRLLLRLRYRIRNDLGLPEDDYDMLLDGRQGA